jgi:hypothetical protein
MLTADQLDVLPGPILELYERFHISILEDIARRLAGLDYMSAAWQVQRMIEAGLLYEQIIERLARLTGQSDQVLRDIFNRAGVVAMRFDDVIYRAAGLDPLPLNLSPQMARILSIGAQKTSGLLRNLVQTTAISAQQLFMDVTDLAYMQVSTGTLDYNTAIREAIKEASSKGLEVIYFESGHRDKIDVATRRAVLTGVNQTAGMLTEARADELDTDLVQTSAHIGARDKGDVPENHEMWQGQVFTRGKDPNNTQYPNFYEVTGYMTVTGLYGVNCVIGDTSVSGPGISAGYRRKYSGEFIVITTARGHELTVTPNHPILTQNGWVAASEIAEGDYVFSRSDLNGKFGVSPNINKSQPSIQEVFRALSVGSVIRSLPASSGNFHGDISNHEVDVVYPDRLLWNRAKTEINQIPIKVFFSLPAQLPASLFSFSAFGEIGVSAFHASNSIMSRLGKRRDFFGGHTLISLFHRIRPVVSNWYSHFFEVFTNRALGDSSGFGDFVLPHARMIHSQQFKRFDLIGSANIRLPVVPSTINTVPLQTVNDGLNGAIMFAGDDRGGDAVIIHPDNVISVERKSPKSSFVHVYNLSTEGEWYFANNIITHNCRHSHYPFFEGISENAYSQAVLDDYASRTATYNGKEMSWYEATQVQRKIEREIRKAKREKAMVEAAGLDSTEERLRVRDLQAVMRDFIKQTGLNRQYVREQMYN